MPRLAQLDDLQPATLDQAVWSANLTALAAEQPALARELVAVTLPETWRPAWALDGFVTFRVEPPGAPAAWLAQSAAPLVRARSRLGRFDPRGKNPALPACGAGAELEFLLARLAAHLAVFVFEADLRALAAILRAHDWSAAIAQGRCIFVPPRRETEFLTGLLEKHPGLLPPGDILLPDLVPPDRIAELRAIGERIHRDTYERRSAALARLSAHPTFQHPSAESTPATPRLALLALSPQAPARRASASLARAAAALGWPVLQSSTADPRSVHPLSLCRALAAFQPDLTVTLGGAGPCLPLTSARQRCTWILEQPAPKTGFPADGTLYLAASTIIADALRAAGVSERDLLDWYWACDTPPPDSDTGASQPTILLIADLPDARPQACGIQQAAHQRLWAQLAQVVGDAWETPHILDPAKLLVRAETACGVQLGSPELRASFLELSERVLIPAITLEQVAQTLAGTRWEPATLGRGWERLSGKSLKSLGVEPLDLLDAGHAFRPSACVLAGRPDPLGPVLLAVAARGWPLLLHSPGAAALPLGHVLRPRQHFVPFTARAELCLALNSLEREPAAWREKAEAARRHVLEHHTYEQRLCELVAHLHGRKKWAASE